ncbi:hypothetical protein OEZ85_009687 [Tetradesmus obliquus]|uniref:Uncharacterized protein n=1 Tax=Tetradesmus obliquus TaxID=3088 RepID=A0ABY8UAI8_TETOB|nr:hypothetical protein OEZ85_009687 [Tetradesmus obliquus]
MTTLQHLTLNHIVPHLTPGFVAQLGSSLTSLQSLELKSCGLAGKHLQGLTPLVQRGLCSLDLFDNPGIGGDVEGSNKALQMWAGTAAPAAPVAAENKCDAETVQAVGQLQQLQQLVLEEAVGPATPPAAFAALAGLTNLELLDISGGPTGCLEELFGSATDGALPAATPQDVSTARAAAAGWHGLRVKWSGRGRPPAGFRQPQQRRSCSSASAGSSRCSSPRVTCGGDTPACGSARCSLRSSLDMQAGAGVGVSDACLSAIVAHCSQLQDLDISHNHVGPDGIALLHALPGLTHLNISCQQPNLSDAAAAALVQLRQLKGLDVGGNSFSKPCEVQLQQQREGSGAGGKLVRLTGCGMRSKLGEPWEQQHVHVVVPGRQSGGGSKPGSPKKVQQQQQHGVMQ